MRTFLAITGAAAFALLASLGCSQEAAIPMNTSTDTRPHYSKSGYDLTPLSKEKIAAVVKTLTPLQVDVTQHEGTERANTGEYVHEKRKGTYVSVIGGLPLFRSEAKFDSGTGWPSFTAPIDKDHVILRADDSLGMRRIEVLDARSGAHLGHVFDDGPAPTGLRFCMNSCALKFIPDGEPLPAESRPVATQTAYFAGGCFWGVEDVFEQIDGVVDAESGYMGGTVDHPTYHQVCEGDTGHAETVKVVFDPARVTYAKLLKIFFDNHDATTPDRQGPDIGPNYRSVVFAATKEQQDEAAKYIQQLQTTPEYKSRRIVTQVVAPGPTFWPAEEYHQDYHKKHGGSCRVKGQ
jgi:peptide methionine sulfoxide reductase msrA/msrB